MSSLWRGIEGRKERYLVVPDFMLKAAYCLGGLLIPLANWAWDQLLPVVSERQARQRRGRPGGPGVLAGELREHTRQRQVVTDRIVSPGEGVPT
jgi:hypothetical protein